MVKCRGSFLEGKELPDFCTSYFRFIVEFICVEAFLKFVLNIQLDVLLYPDDLSFTVSLKIGRCRFVLT